MAAIITSAGTSVVSGPTIVCCNGGYPYVDLIHWQPKSTHFIADIGPGADNCQSYRSRFFNEKSYQNYVQMNGNIACRCKTDYYGSQCQLKRDDYNADATSGNGSSFKMSLFLAVVPLTFAVFAAVGGFFCKMFPCCVCFNISWPKNCPGFGRKMSGDNSADYDDGEYDDDDHRQNIHVDVHSVDLAPVEDWIITSGHCHLDDTAAANSSARIFNIASTSNPSSAIDPTQRPLISNCQTTVPLMISRVPFPDDPPPPFSAVDEPEQCRNCSRKYSPPPPYSELAQSSNPLRTTSTQTFT